jgi:hypothetical protein
MATHPRFTLFALLTFVSASCAFAQTTSPSQPDETAPEAASSPHQRQTTETDAAESPTTTATEPSSSSTPHQRQATKTADKAKSHDQMMKDCVSKERAKDSATTQQQAMKNCSSQMESKTDMPAG